MNVTKIRNPAFRLHTDWDNICIGLALSVQETILMLQNTWEITAHQNIYIRQVKA